MARYDPLFHELPPCIMRVGYWLLLLTEPGQSMIFIPSEMGLKSTTLQQYVWQLADVLEIRYRITGGVARGPGRKPRNPPAGTPLTVTRLRS